MLLPLGSRIRTSGATRKASRIVSTGLSSWCSTPWMSTRSNESSGQGSRWPSPTTKCSPGSLRRPAATPMAEGAGSRPTIRRGVAGQPAELVPDLGVVGHPDVGIPGPVRHRAPGRLDPDGEPAPSDLDDIREGALDPGADVVHGPRVRTPVGGDPDEGVARVVDVDEVSRNRRIRQRWQLAAQPAGDQARDEPARLLLGAVDRIQAKRWHGDVPALGGRAAGLGGGSLAP